MSMKKHFWILALFFPLTLAGCETMGGVTSWFGDEDAQAEIADDEEAAPKFVTVTVKDRYGFRIKDPMGQRTTGGHCGIWKDQAENTQGACCWNNRGECGCPCPDS